MLDSFAPPPPKPEAAKARGLQIRPEVFFYPPWRGTGLICDGFGLPKERYQLRGKGRTLEDGSIVIEQCVEFESGAKDPHEWVYAPANGDQISARDLVTGKELRGRMTPRGFEWSYPLMAPTPFGLRRCSAHVEFVLSNQHEASTTVSMSLFGVVFSTATSHVRHDSVSGAKAA